MNYVEYTTVIRDFLIDFTSLYLFSYVIIYRKYRNTELFVSCALFNVFVLIIVMAIIRTNFNVAIGFGLFALLSLIQLRSAQFSKTEMAYLFGAVTLAVINGAGISDLTFVLICNAIVVGCSWAVGTWSLEHSANLIAVDNIRKISVTLDQIVPEAISDSGLMKANLGETLGLDVQSFEIKKVDYVRDTVDLSVLYKLPETEIPQHFDNVGSEPLFERVWETKAAPTRR